MLSNRTPSLARNLRAHGYWMTHDKFGSFMEPPGKGQVLRHYVATALRRSRFAARSSLLPYFGATR